MIFMIFMIIIYHKNNSRDTFAIPLSPKEINDNDGHMTFDFLTDLNTNYVLNNYYINDDTKINGTRVNYHKYQEQVPNYPIEGAPPYIYGTLLNHYQRRPKVWNKYDTYAQDIYNQYGIRR